MRTDQWWRDQDARERWETRWLIAAVVLAATPLWVWAWLSLEAAFGWWIVRRMIGV